MKVIAKLENYILGNSSNSLLFVYRSKWQMDLIKRYRNEMVLLDGTYKTTRYSLLLFFMVVKTNVDYQIVASFVIENETYEAISETVAVIKSWNAEFDPKYGMTDCCHEEIRAVENNFRSTV